MINISLEFASNKIYLQVKAKVVNLEEGDRDSIAKHT